MMSHLYNDFVIFRLYALPIPIRLVLIGLANNLIFCSFREKTKRYYSMFTESYLT